MYKLIVITGRYYKDRS